MLRFLKLLFSPIASVPMPDGRQIGFWSKEELSDLSPRLARIFEVSSLDRDYENAWEWLESTTTDGLHVNISRTHDWETGDHHLPVVVSLRRGGGFLSAEEVERWARKLAESLDVDVSVGSVTEEETKTSEYGFRCDHVFYKPSRGQPDGTDNDRAAPRRV